MSRYRQEEKKRKKEVDEVKMFKKGRAAWKEGEIQLFRREKKDTQRSKLQSSHAPASFVTVISWRLGNWEDEDVQLLSDSA
jgi:hypothetical protein